NRHGTEHGRTAIALAQAFLRALRHRFRMRQRQQRGRGLLVHGRKLSPANAGRRRRRLPLSGLLARHGAEGNGMTLRAWIGAALMGGAAAVPGAAADMWIRGRGQMAAAVPAPWARRDQQAALATQGKHLLKTEVTFAPGSVISKFKPFNCKSKVLYEPNS